jgi:hypothetical protein
MDFFKILVAVLMLRWGHEGGVGETDNRWVDKKPEVEELTQLFINTAEEGKLVDPHTDAMILATQAWYESRISLKPPDGDPMHLRTGDVGTVVGPMQISKAAPGWVKLWPELGQWNGLTVKEMREPKVNVALAYDILQLWKKLCGGPPGVWIDAYGMGHCPKKWGDSYGIGWEGRRRCKTLTWMMKKTAEKGAYTMPEGWNCTGLK